MPMTLHRLPLQKLQQFDDAAVVTDADLAALRPDGHRVDDGLEQMFDEHQDVFAYILRPEGRIAQEHEEIAVGYVTPGKLKERLGYFEHVHPAAVREELGEEELPVAYFEKNIGGLREYVRPTVDQGWALLIVQTF
jgi:hypothetical protein